MQAVSPRFLTVGRRSITALAALAATIVGVPAAGAGEFAAPVLWEGVVQTPDGQPTAAEIVAYVRNSASEMEPGNSLVRLGRATADSSGHFTLRAVPTPALETATDEAGWATIMVAAISEKGVSLAVDSVAWKPEASGKHTGKSEGRWVTNPGDLLAGVSETKAFRASEAESVAATAQERPNVLVVSDSPGKTFAPMSDPSHSPDPGWCVGPKETKDIGVSPVGVGELHLNRNWGGLFSYTNTKNTSFQIGVSQDGKSWRAGGSKSMGKNSSFGQDQPLVSARNERFWTWKADMVFKRFKWTCGMPGRWQTLYTIEPVEWTGGLRQVDGGAPPACNPQYTNPVVPGGTAWREKGSSISLEGAISVAGFHGSATSAFSESVRNEWRNTLSTHRNLCGSRARLATGDTRVHSFA